MSRPRLTPPDIEYSSSLSQVAYLLLEEGRKDDRNPYNIRLNEFTGEMELNGKEVTDTDIINAAMELEMGFRWRGRSPSVSKIWDAARWVARERAYHPVRDYLESLTWDGVERAAGLLEHYAGAIADESNRELLRTQSRMILLGAVARVMSPGCKLDTMPVLIGGQGCGKSTFCRLLAANHSWFSDTPLRLDTKDAYQALSGCWLMEVAELKSLQGASAETRKAFLTSGSDRFRPPYGRAMVTRPRQVFFIGTSNRLELHDSTGARRYWPIPVRRPRVEDLTRDVGQLWAEALHLYKNTSHAWHITDTRLLEHLQTQAEDYTVADPWLASLEAYAKTVDWFTISEFLTHLGISDASKTHKNTLRAARLCRALDMEQGRSRSSGKRTRIWRFR